MPLSEEMRRLIMQGSNAIAIADQARKEGIPDLRESGLKKAKNGFTSLAEINRVVSKD
jgi:type IV pilus assembly protein PilB